MPFDTLLCPIPGDNPPLPIFKKIVRLNGSASGISYARQCPNYYPEHTHSHIQILVPFEGTSIRLERCVAGLVWDGFVILLRRLA